MPEKIFKYILLSLLLQSTILSYSQPKHIGIPQVKNYNTSKMHAGAQTWMIDIGSNGLAYFANNNGVLEFDGINWRNHPLPGGILVRCIKATQNNKLYAGGFNEIGYLLPNDKGQLNYHSLIEKLPENARDFGEVWRIYDLPVGIVFQSYEQLMIYNNGHFKIIDAPEMFHFSFLVKGELYINDQTKGLYRLANDQIVKVPGVSQVAGELIWSMLPKGDDILIATDDDGIFVFDGLKLKEWKKPAARLLKKNQVYTGLSIDDATYAFGTIQDGIVICDTAGNLLQHLNMDRGLQNNTVLSLKLDQYKNLWLGLDNGIDYIEINSPLTYFSEFNALSTGYAAILHNNMLYLGTNRGVFYHDWQELQKGGGSQTFKLVPGTQGQVWNFDVFDGTLFCGHNSGVFTIEGTRAELISDIQGGWTFIQPENKNDIVLCGTYTGISKFEKINGQWVENGKLGGFKESTRYLVQGKNNTFWISHGYKGIYRVNVDSNYDSIINFELYNSDDGFPVDKNLNVCNLFDKPVFTTGQGFYRFDSVNNKLEPELKLNKRFPRQDIRLVHPDDAGNVWYFTIDDAGVYRLQEDGSYVDVFLPFKELNRRFIKWFQFVYPINDNHVIFGLQDGFAYYTPQYPKDYQYEFNAYIRKATLTKTDSVLYMGQTQNKDFFVGIPYRFNQIKFELAANDFENPKKLVFSTKLEDFDEEWSPWRSNPVREFTNLAHGEYTFKVRAKNIFDNISNTGSIDFEIYAPWFLSWWGYALYAAIVGMFIFSMVRYVRYRTEKTKREEEEQQKRLFQEREKQLQNNALRAEKEVIRIRNEKLRAEMKQKDKELANNTMEMIQKGKLLTKIKKELNKLSTEFNDDIINNHINRLIRRVDKELDTEQQWEVFEKHFENVHEEFLKRLKAAYPDLTPREMKLCAYLRLNISSKEIAALMNISTRGVEISRYRLRKKLQLSHDTNLTDFIISF